MTVPVDTLAAVVRQALGRHGESGALDALDDLVGRDEAEVARLREQRDDLLNRLEISGALRKEEEARCARLQQALTEIEGLLKRRRDREGSGPLRALNIARNALQGDPERHVRAFLAGPATPADSQEDKT